MSSTIFSGTSRYSQDFQQVIQRAVNIASLPLTQLNQQKLNLTDQQTALNDLETKFSAIGDAISKLSGGVTSGSLQIGTGNSNVASATITGQALPGVFSLNVTSLGAYSSALSGTGVSDPTSTGITSAASLTLTVDGQAFTIQPADHSLSALVKAINASAAGVQANMINLGSPGSPDYRLALQSSKLGAIAMSLNDGSSELLSLVSPGSPAVYTVNGQPQGGISSSSRTVTLAPGVTADLVGTGTTDISVTQSPSLLTTSLSAFVTAFNAAVDGMDKQHGKSGGALSGDSILPALTAALSAMGNYSSGGTSLHNLGMEFDSTGHLTINTSVVSGMSADQFRQVSAFLGDGTTDGFLKTATSVLNQLTDSTNGLFKASLDTVATSIKNSDALIAANQQRVSDLQSNLEQRMAAADALIASMEQQVTYFNALFSAMQPNSNK